MFRANQRPMQLKNVNRISVLNYIRRNRFTTKAALASESGLTFMAIQKIMEELMALGLVRQDALQGGYVGRKAVTYTIDENYGYTIGLHINMFKTRAAVMNLHGEIIAYHSIDMSSIQQDPTVLIEALVEAVNKVIEDSGVDRQKLLGVGVGAPGPINIQEGRILSPPNLTVLRYLPLKKILEDRLGLSVLLHKDTNAIAMGEYWRGAGADHSNMVYIDADIGIGSGLILGGEMHEGANSIAGEFGHITLDIHGPLCNCGNHGCLEALGSGISILKVLDQKLAERPEHPLRKNRRELSIQQVLDAGNGGDPLAASVLNDAAYFMGMAVGNLINILDPEVIILGGILALEYVPYFEIVKGTVQQKALAVIRENLIVPTVNAFRAGVIGAGEIVADNFFTTLVYEVLSKN